MAPTLFIDSQGKMTSLQPGMIIPAIIRPLDQNPSYSYNYFNLFLKKTLSLLPSAYASPGWIYNGSVTTKNSLTPTYSNGETWAPLAGVPGTIFPVGSIVPPGWIAVTGVIAIEDVAGIGNVKVDTGSVQTTDIPSGYTAYTTPSSSVIVVPSEQSVPADWIPASPTNTEVYQTDMGAVVVDPTDPNAYAPPGYVSSVSSGSSYFWKILGGIIGVAGVAGVAYVGYLAYQDPQRAARIIENAAKGAGFIITVVQATTAVVILGALSFVGWQFWKAMDANDGNVALAIGSMIASAIETFVTAIVDAVEQLAKDAWTFIFTEIKSILPSWL